MFHAQDKRNLRPSRWSLASLFSEQRPLTPVEILRHELGEIEQSGRCRVDVVDAVVRRRILGLEGEPSTPLPSRSTANLVMARNLDYLEALSSRFTRSSKASSIAKSKSEKVVAVATSFARSLRQFGNVKLALRSARFAVSLADTIPSRRLEVGAYLEKARCALRAGESLTSTEVLPMIEIAHTQLSFFDADGARAIALQSREIIRDLLECQRYEEASSWFAISQKLQRRLAFFGRRDYGLATQCRRAELFLRSYEERQGLALSGPPFLTLARTLRDYIDQRTPRARELVLSTHIDIASLSNLLDSRTQLLGRQALVRALSLYYPVSKNGPSLHELSRNERSLILLGYDVLAESWLMAANWEQRARVLRERSRVWTLCFPNLYDANGGDAHINRA